MNLGVISRNIGIALIATSLFMFISAGVAAADGFDSSFFSLLFSAIITALIGLFPLLFVHRSKDINTKEGLAILIFSWLLCCIFSMLPYVLWGGEFTVVNAWFESASGITTTGATVLRDIESLPKGLLFWRSSTHYIGGLGVVVFIAMILPSIGTVRYRISKMDVEDISRSNYQYKSNKFIKVVVTVYIGLTVSAIAMLTLAGMPFFDAVNHAFSVVATGGFSTRNNSIAGFDSPAIEGILMLFMILSSIHFGLIYASIANRNLKLLKDPVTKFYLTTILIFAILITVNLLASETFGSFKEALRNSSFAVISTISTTGFAINDTNNWPVFSILLLLYTAIQCGCAGSTTSGVRSDRIWILFKATRAQLIKIAHPNAVVQTKSGGQTIDRDLYSSVSVYLLVYLFLVLVGAVLYSAMDFDLISSLSTSISMMSNVGPSFGTYGSSMSTFANAPSFSKLLMGFQMIIGRLGVYSILSFFFLFRKDS